MKTQIETYIIDVIYGREKGWKAEVLRKVLFLFSKLYSVIVRLRLFLYNCGVFRKKTLGCLIISIGNITVGGTGKTPLVEMFARELTIGKRKVAVLSRGYKRKKHFSVKNLLSKEWWIHSPLVVSNGEKVMHGSKDAGDEPYMLAKNLSDVIILVDKNRVKSGSYAIENYGVDTLILDDGFQYLPLNRRLNIVLVDATNPFGNGHLLPRGILREPLTHLSRADIFFITKADGRDTQDIKNRLRQYNERAEIVECCYEPMHLVEMYSNEHKELSSIERKKVVAVTAIADPEGFESLIERLGGTIVTRYRYPDHHRFTHNEIETVVETCKKTADIILITEKDSVRFPILKDCSLPIAYLKVEVKIKSGALDFKDCVSRLCEY
ncbi:MAG: tetraacyldisaccharide 4'-kinase [Candidatus Ancaeobacter aquaticus]|nr:tetraacyldisaccharide 4'-kinase [Candidatus Ancaeobacter aquaticus]